VQHTPQSNNNTNPDEARRTEENLAATQVVHSQEAANQVTTLNKHSNLDCFLHYISANIVPRPLLRSRMLQPPLSQPKIALRLQPEMLKLPTLQRVCSMIIAVKVHELL